MRRQIHSKGGTLSRAPVTGAPSASRLRAPTSDPMVPHRVWPEVQGHQPSPARSQAFEVRPNNAVPMTPWSGLLPATRNIPTRWAHRNCIVPASCCRPPRRPRTEACTRGDLTRRPIARKRRRLNDWFKTTACLRTKARRPRSLTREIPFPKS